MSASVAAVCVTPADEVGFRDARARGRPDIGFTWSRLVGGPTVLGKRRKYACVVSPVLRRRVMPPRGGDDLRNFFLVPPVLEGYALYAIALIDLPL